MITPYEYTPYSSRFRSLLIFAILAAAALVFTSYVAAHAAVKITPSQVESILPSGRTGTIVYVNNSDTKAYFIDFSKATYSAKLLCSKTGVGSPLISPDGGLVAFHIANVADKFKCDGRNTAETYVCELKENASAKKICNGFSPHWWIKDNKTYLIYKTEYCKSRWPNHPGKTMKQQIDPGTLDKIGDAVELFSQGLNGGLSKSGRWLCHAYNTVDMVDLENGEKHYQLYGGGQGCNASISPTSDPSKENRMMHLELPHATFAVRDNTDKLIWRITNPSGSEEWQAPEWSAHENYCTATAKHGDGYNVYMIRISDKKMHKVVDGDNSVPHLWVGESSTSIRLAAINARFARKEPDLHSAGIELFTLNGGSVKRYAAGSTNLLHHKHPFSPGVYIIRTRVPASSGIRRIARIR
jgi:hypothetical protein